MSTTTPRTALVAGATGLTGGFLVPILVASPWWQQVRLVVRRPFAPPSAGAVEDRLDVHVVDFDDLEAATEPWAVDDVFCCLGTTIKKAGSRAAFRRVDLHAVATIARLARAAGAQRFVLISSVGADVSARSFYLQVKGEAESAVRECGFQQLHILRPGILTGPRQENRPAERLGIAVGRLLAPCMIGGLRGYRPIAAATVATAMAMAARHGEDGHHLYGNVEIHRLAALAPGDGVID